VIILSEIGTPGSPGTDLHEKQTKRISDVAAPLHAVMARFKAEVAVLAQELKCLGAD
jgi:hypothetical protein